MAARPSGMVTFLFTDVEGSTALWEQHADPMRTARGHHDEILRATIEGHGGYVFSTGGDGFAAVFDRAIERCAPRSPPKPRLRLRPGHRVERCVTRSTVAPGALPQQHSQPSNVAGRSYRAKAW